jgi:hypothetical protein
MASSASLMFGFSCAIAKNNSGLRNIQKLIVDFGFLLAVVRLDILLSLVILSPYHSDCSDDNGCCSCEDAS